MTPAQQAILNRLRHMFGKDARLDLASACGLSLPAGAVTFWVEDRRERA